MDSKTFLITGAATGFGRDIALSLASAGHHVIAGVEVVAQIQDLVREARARALPLQVEKLDVTDEADRRRAADWKVDVLLNNAGISEGGSSLDIPAEHLRRQFEVNVFGPLLLTQRIARGMIQRGSGRIVFMSSVAGLTVDPFTGAYSGSKHAVEAFAEALRAELQSFGIEVATINPGPFLTGFNDRMFETWRTWQDNPSDRVYDYAGLAFPHEQHDPAAVVQLSVDVLLGRERHGRNIVPPALADQVRRQQAEAWTRLSTDGLGEAPPLVRKARELEPETPADD